MVGIVRVVRVAAQGLGPGRCLALVLDERLALGQRLQREDALAVHAGAAHLDAAAAEGRVGGGRCLPLVACAFILWYIEIMGARVCERACAREAGL
jgi:hypothetical protein